jgi:hypothetical protein
LAYIYLFRICVWFRYNETKSQNQPAQPRVPLPVIRALRKLGQDIRDARRRRRIPVAVAAERASISKTTWLKVEKGDPGVLVGTYVCVLFVLGLIDRVSALADPSTDNVGLRLEEEQLPQRIRQRKRKSTGAE